jgi:hypothetical protein
LEIIKVCRDIQGTWSAPEELRRRSAVDQVWHPAGAESAVQIPAAVPAED